MQYQEFKTNFLTNVYIPYISGDKGKSRINLAKIYNEGISTPRATKYQIISSMTELSDFYDEAYKTLNETKQYERASKLCKDHIKFFNELSKSEHPIVMSAQNKFLKSMAQIYLSKRTQRISSFIMLKKEYPFLEKLKFLTKFL